MTRLLGLIYLVSGIWCWTEIYKIGRWRNTCLCSRLYPMFNINNKEDKLVWNLCKNGAFSAKSLYNHMAGHNIHPRLGFPANIIWKSKAPPRISFFWLGKLLKSAFLLWTIFIGEVLLWSIDVTSANPIWRSPTTCSSGVHSHTLFGLWVSALWA